MNKRLVPTLAFVCAAMFGAAAIADIAIIFTRPLRPWFAWMLP